MARRRAFRYQTTLVVARTKRDIKSLLFRLPSLALWCRVSAHCSDGSVNSTILSFFYAGLVSCAVSDTLQWRLCTECDRNEEIVGFHYGTPTSCQNLRNMFWPLQLSWNIVLPLRRTVVYKFVLKKFRASPLRHCHALLALSRGFFIMTQLISLPHVESLVFFIHTVEHSFINMHLSAT